MSDTQVILKPGKEKALLNHHHWIFSGAICSLPNFEDGALLPVYSQAGLFLGSGYFNKRSKIIGRMLSFDCTPPLEALQQKLDAALAFRRVLFSNKETTGYRLVNGEGDGLPGLVIDCYNDVAVIQITTLGMERLKEVIVSWLLKHISLKIIYEKSESGVRKEEGLMPRSVALFGSDLLPVEIVENGIAFSIDFVRGQKTGFFCDQRLMRQLVKKIALGKSVLNCFSYTGGFSLYALSGGARLVDSVDLSEEALVCAKKNVEINGFDKKKANFYQEDVFAFLRNHPLDYDLIILDPPAFAKKKKDIVAACRGYKEINRIALQRIPRSSYLLTSSCSHYVDSPLFQKVVFQAAIEANRTVRIIGHHQMAEDHPINICHPESEYLKSLLLYVE